MVSLVPSVTETLVAWGLPPIACTRFCDQPSLPEVGGTKDPDVARVAALRPDLVVLDCEENRLEDHDALVAAGVPVHVLTVRSTADVGPELGGLAARLGVTWEPPVLRTPHPRPAVAVFVPIWRRPWMALGQPTYGASLLAALGFETVHRADGPYPVTTLEEGRARGPAAVLAPNEPYPFTRRQVPELSTVAPVRLIDGRDLFWWGWRTPRAFERLAEALADLHRPFLRP